MTDIKMTTATLQLLTKRSHGLKATLARVQHHAPKIRGLVLYLSRRVSGFGDHWWQGDTVHDIRASTGQIYKLRGVTDRSGYAGVSLSCYVGRGKPEILLMTVFYDERNGVSWDHFATQLEVLATGRKT